MSGRTLLISLLAALGLVAAAGVGLLVNSISDDSIGLGAAPLSAGRDLAPPEAREEQAERREGRLDRARDRREERREAAQDRREEAREQAGVTTPGDDSPEFEGEDDNSGPGSSSSGSGSGESDDD